VPQIARTPENEQAAFDRAVAMLERIHGMARSANGDYSRPNVLKQTRSFQDLENPVLLPGIKVNTRATNYHPIRAMQLARWNGHMWVRFGEVIEGGTTWWAASQWPPAEVSIQLPRPANPPPMTNALATTAPDCPPSTPNPSSVKSLKQFMEKYIPRYITISNIPTATAQGTRGGGY
jgi:hypothetical protein